MTRERRKFPRLPQSFDVRYRRSGELDEGWRTVQTLNLSAGGVRFRDTELLQKGDTLDLRIQLPGGREPLALQGYVVWCQHEASGVMDTGVQFMDIAPGQQFQIDSLVQFLRKSEPPPSPQP